MQKTLNKTKIQLPTKNGEIDFEFITKYMEAIEKERLTTLESYLTLNKKN